MPKEHKLIVSFPYSLVRHPAAAFFLWAYWVGIPSYNANHILLASLWTVFIVVGTLIFEEGGLVDHEFKQLYTRYSNKVNAFVPSVWSIKHCLGLLEESEKWKEE
jgi:protein-S-isoprenylcysteine O-methyltransferase Ste14